MNFCYLVQTPQGLRHIKDGNELDAFMKAWFRLQGSFDDLEIEVILLV